MRFLFPYTLVDCYDVVMLCRSLLSHSPSPPLCVYESEMVFRAKVVGAESESEPGLGTQHVPLHQYWYYEQSVNTIFIYENRE